MTQSPVHLATIQRGTSHLTACGTVSRLVTCSPGDATCPECARLARMERERVPGHLLGCVEGRVYLAPLTYAYCACAHRVRP